MLNVKQGSCKYQLLKSYGLRLELDQEIEPRSAECGLQGGRSNH